MASVVIDHHLLRDVLVGERPADLGGLAPGGLATTGLWLLRLCSSLAEPSVVGKLSAPVVGLPAGLQAKFRAQLTSLPAEIEVLPLREREGNRDHAARLTPVFAELHYPPCALALGHTSTAALFNNAGRPAQNQTAILEWVVDDVDAEYERLKPIVSNWEQDPTLMPWGNRSILFRDPDGNLVNLFTPATPDAIKRFRGQSQPHPGPVILGAVSAPQRRSFPSSPSAITVLRLGDAEVEWAAVARARGPRRERASG